MALAAMIFGKWHPVVLGIAWFSQGGQTPPLPDSVRLDPLGQQLGAWVAQVPFVGRALAIALFGHTVLVYLALALVVGVWWLLFRTRFGLRLRAAGENPAMVDAAGVSVLGLRYQALVLNGVLASLAGAYLVLAQNPSFIPNMTAGRGYMALAAMIFGKWHPVGALFACLLFGFLDAVSIRLQGAELPLIGAVPVQAIQALPYVLTVVLLAGFIGRAVAPAALGRPYVKER
jgi:simple sugar transport system permease protein